MYRLLSAVITRFRRVGSADRSRERDESLIKTAEVAALSSSTVAREKLPPDGVAPYIYVYICVCVCTRFGRRRDGAVNCTRYIVAVVGNGENDSTCVLERENDFPTTMTAAVQMTRKRKPQCLLLRLYEFIYIQRCGEWKRLKWGRLY